MNIPFADRLLFGYLRWRHGGGARVAPIETLRLADVRRVLLVLTTGLGDTVLSTPVFPNLRAALPRADIRLFCRRQWLGLFRHDPDLDGVIPYYGKYRRLFSTLRALRGFAPDLTLVLHGNDPDIVPLAYLGGSRYIARIPWATTRYSFLLSNTARPQDAATVPGLHYIENRLRILDTIGVRVSTRTPRVVLSAEAASRVPAQLAGRRYWIYHGFAADSFKVWPRAKAQRFLADALKEFGEYSLVLTGGRRDRRAVAELARDLPPERVLNLAGKLDITGTAACLKGAACVVAPDTGILHLAAALDVPVVGLYAPTSAELVGPRAARAAAHIVQKPRTCDPCRDKHCPYLPKNCMDQIGAGEVLDALRRVLRLAA